MSLPTMRQPLENKSYYIYNMKKALVILLTITIGLSFPACKNSKKKGIDGQESIPSKTYNKELTQSELYWN